MIMYGDATRAQRAKKIADYQQVSKQTHKTGATICHIGTQTAKSEEEKKAK